MFLQQLAVVSASGTAWLSPAFAPTLAAYTATLPHHDEQAAVRLVAPLHASRVQLVTTAAAERQTLAPGSGQWTTTAMLNISMGSVTTIELLVTAEVREKHALSCFAGAPV
jgi:hypothetical protein